MTFERARQNIYCKREDILLESKLFLEIIQPLVFQSKKRFLFKTKKASSKNQSKLRNIYCSLISRHSNLD